MTDAEEAALREHYESHYKALENLFRAAIAASGGKIVLPAPVQEAAWSLAVLRTTDPDTGSEIFEVIGDPNPEG